MFTQAPCQASPDFSAHSKLFILTVDFSKVAVGAVLSQEQQGKERFLKGENVEFMRPITIPVKVNFWHLCMVYRNLTTFSGGKSFLWSQ